MWPSQAPFVVHCHIHRPYSAYDPFRAIVTKTLPLFVIGVPLLSWAIGSEAKATLRDRFPRRVCKKEKKISVMDMSTSKYQFINRVPFLNYDRCHILSQKRLL